MTDDSPQSELECFDSPTTETHQVYTFETDELTAVCPFDFGGPDFYLLEIRYVPCERALESKSLKKYLEGFRDEGVTAEHLAVEIHDTIEVSISPRSLYVRLEQARRGGIEGTVEVGDVDLR